MMSNDSPSVGLSPVPDEALQTPPPSTPSHSYMQHSISAAYPPMPDAEFMALVEDIKAHGQRVPITLYEGKILDGWHRYCACPDLGLEPATVDFTGTSENAVAFAFSLNAHRRQLAPGQLALLAVELFLPRFEAEALVRQRSGKRAVNEDLSASGRTGGRHGPSRPGWRQSRICPGF